MFKNNYGGDGMKLIIKFDESEISYPKAIEYVNAVIAKGFISSTNNHRHYCHVTVFIKTYVVYASITKSGTHTFKIFKEPV